MVAHKLRLYSEFTSLVENDFLVGPLPAHPLYLSHAMQKEAYDMRLVLGFSASLLFLLSAS